MSADRRRAFVWASVNRFLALLLAITLAAALVAVGTYSPPAEGQEEPHTEFYLLGPEGEAGGYPTTLSVDEVGAVTVGITNDEPRQTTYTVVQEVDGEVETERTVDVEAGATWEDRFIVRSTEPGDRRIEFLLFRGEPGGDRSDPYRDLQLDVRVR